VGVVVRMYIDVFNGDADGICALHQIRLAEPLESELITGVKRDISLLSRVSAHQGDQVTVLDISLDKNREALTALLNNGVSIRYYDHHFAGDIPENENLLATINTDPSVCTSLLVSRTLEDKFLSWAVTAAFGDNLFDSALTAAKPLNLSEQLLEQLKILGTSINYNGYGSSIEDLFYHPADLYRKIKPYEDPFEFIASDAAFVVLSEGFQSDMEHAATTSPEYDAEHTSVYILPDEKWARRVSGIFGNDLAQLNPNKAHAVLTHKGDGYQVSVRAPLATKTGADMLCRQFETGGGRQAAAGINYLSESDLEGFVAKFQQYFIP